MNKSTKMYRFSSKLWYDKRWLNSAGEGSLYLQILINGKHKEFPLKFKWPVNKIDRDAGELLPRFRGDSQVDDYNMIIRQEQARHSEIFLTYRLKKAPIDIERFAAEVKIYDQHKSFTAYVLSEAMRRYKRKEIVKRTWTNHNTIYTKMVEFNDTWDFNELTVRFMKKFKGFLLAAGHDPNYVWTIIKTVKAYLKFASLETMLHVDQEVVEFPNPVPTWKTNFLNIEEIRRLMLIYNQGYLTRSQQYVLAAFLFTVFTSLRISDVYRVNAEWRLSEDFLDFIPKKNEKKRKWVHIPLVPMAKQFIQSLTGKYFELPSEGEYNKILKDLAVKADIKKNLTSHLGRHSFGYLYMTTAGNLKGLQEIMGHSKIETTMRYAHLDDEYMYTSAKLIQGAFTDLFTMRKVK